MVQQRKEVIQEGLNRIREEKAKEEEEENELLKKDPSFATTGERAIIGNFYFYLKRTEFSFIFNNL
jgi:hypothetical protein